MKREPTVEPCLVNYDEHSYVINNKALKTLIRVFNENTADCLLSKIKTVESSLIRLQDLATRTVLKNIEDCDYVGASKIIDHLLAISSAKSFFESIMCGMYGNITASETTLYSLNIAKVGVILEALIEIEKDNKMSINSELPYSIIKDKAEYGNCILLAIDMLGEASKNLTVHVFDCNDSDGDYTPEVIDFIKEQRAAQ